jgi:hypothetical protein
LKNKALLEFFETSGRNLLAAEAAAGVRHHVALSIVGIDRGDNGYFRAKLAQEKLIEASGISYTIIRATQFSGIRRCPRYGQPGPREQLEQPCRPRRMRAFRCRLFAGGIRTFSTALARACRSPEKPYCQDHRGERQDRVAACEIFFTV